MTSAPAVSEGAEEKAAVIVLLGPSGLATAERLKRALDGAEVHGAAGRLSPAEVDHAFQELGGHLRRLFRAGRPLLVLAAAAIPIRLLAPLLDDKRTEPPVLAVAEDGSAVVPLLGGHHGANDLARRAAAALGTTPAITTAGDLRLGVALDRPPAGWRIADPNAAKPVTAALLAGEPVTLDVETPLDDGWVDGLRGLCRPDGKHRIKVTDRASTPPPGTLVYHPKTLVLGVGCERGTEADELIELAEKTLAGHGLAEDAVAAVVSITLKAAEPAVHALAAHLGVPARFFDAATLERETPRLANPSELVFRETGCHGVAEGAALAAVGADGDLIVEKTKSRRATLALARARNVIPADGVGGRPQGHLAIVGIGPGSPGWRSPEADRLLAASDRWIGYRGYLDLLPRPDHVTAEGFALGEEEDRATRAIELAAGGAKVALISSGDAGIYAMAALVLELLDQSDDPAWQRIEVTVTPGISALQAAAARTGAPLGHDFCAISLSDLLTPWAVIERRLLAAAEGDFVIALYNPASERRRQGLSRAISILSRTRPPSTPVIIARNLGRTGETVDVVELQAFDQERIDMMTLIIVGSASTRMAPRLHGRPLVYTPRGYRDARIVDGDATRVDRQSA